MFKFTVVIFALISCAAAKPALICTPLAYTASAVVATPAAVVAVPAPVTATSSQFIAHNHNGIATAHVVAPVSAYSAPLAYTAQAPVLL